MSLRWTQDELETYLRKFARPDRAAVSTADLESDSRHAAAPADAGKKVDQKFRVHFHSKRKRLIDIDGLYSKAAIDGLTEGGILADDSPDILAAVSYSQEKTDLDEETIIEIFEIKREGT